MHSSLAVYGVAFVVWLILNLSRVLLVSSYKKLRLGSTSYQDVRQSIVEMVTNRIVLPATKKGEIVWNQTSDMHKSILGSIAQKEKQQRVEAYVFTVLALLLQMVWIGFLVTLAPFLSRIHELNAFVDSLFHHTNRIVPKIGGILFSPSLCAFFSKNG